MDAFFSSVEKLAAEYAQNISIPDVEATVSGVDIQAKNLHVTHFAEPLIKYSLLPGNKINGTVTLPSVGFEGPFEATRRVSRGLQEIWVKDFALTTTCEH